MHDKISHTTKVNGIFTLYINNIDTKYLLIFVETTLFYTNNDEILRFAIYSSIFYLMQLIKSFVPQNYPTDFSRLTSHVEAEKGNTNNAEIATSAVVPSSIQLNFHNLCWKKPTKNCDNEHLTHSTQCQHIVNNELYNSFIMLVNAHSFARS